MYGFGSKNILGVANADFILNEATQLGLESKRFSFEPALIGRENILYTKFNPILDGNINHLLKSLLTGLWN